MTKEQEVITYIKKQIKICNENADVCDDNDFNEEATYLREESYMLETVLSMLKQKDKEIEKKDKIIDLMSEWLYEDDTSFGYGKLKDINTSEKIKQYFERKATNNG